MSGSRAAARRRGLALALLSLLCVPAAGASAAEWDLSGFIAGELRAFPEEPAFRDQRDTYLAPSVFAEPKLEVRPAAYVERLTFVPFVRWDAHDSRRTHADIREVNGLFVGDGWDLVVGIDRRFWGATESRHLVDIINQTDLVEDTDEEDKLGQPMVNLNLIQPWGTLGLYVLPGFRERTFPEGDARLRGPLPIRTGDAEYGAGASRGDVALAARYTKTFGPVDVGLSHFRGTGREPRLLPQVEADGKPVLVPFYEEIDQTGLDLQLTRGGWLWKLEAITRGGQGDRFAAAVGGFEYTFFNVAGSNVDLGVLGEYLYDGRDDDDAPPTPHDDDAFLGLRLELNDPETTRLLAGVTLDRTEGDGAFKLEAERRIGERWRLSLDVRLFWDGGDAVLAGVEDDGYVQLRLALFI